jgi:hypothetical protein
MQTRSSISHRDDKENKCGETREVKARFNDPHHRICVEGIESIVLPSGPAKRRSIGSSEAAATTTAAAAMTAATPISTTAAAASGVASHLRETGVDVLLRILQDRNEVTGLFSICGKLAISDHSWKVVRLTLCCEERDSCAFLSSTSSSADPMNIVLRIVGVVVVEDMSNISYILSGQVSNLANGSLTERRGPCVVV